MARTGSLRTQGRILMCLVRLRLRHLLQPPISNPACALLLCHRYLFLFLKLSNDSKQTHLLPPSTPVPVLPLGPAAHSREGIISRIGSSAWIILRILGS